jgi:glycosyltransferase involved in cell wall biosynthesis
VIAISDFERSLLVRAGLPAQRATILAPGVDLEPLRTSRPLNYEKYGFDRGQRVIVSLGRLALGKRVDRLISAMPEVLKRHPEARLLIIGPDYGDLTRLRELASSLKLTGVIRFAGALPADDVAAALQHAWAFAMTTDFELFGITLIEAMAAGTAVVAHVAGRQRTVKQASVRHHDGDPRPTTVPWLYTARVSGLSPKRIVLTFKVVLSKDYRKTGDENSGRLQY